MLYTRVIDSSKIDREKQTTIYLNQSLNRCRTCTVWLLNRKGFNFNGSREFSLDSRLTRIINQACYDIANSTCMLTFVYAYLLYSSRRSSLLLFLFHFFSLFFFPPFHLTCTSSDHESSLSLRKIIVTIN